MKLIVGLGNPGAKYDKSRHNAGFMVVDRLAQLHAGGETAKGRFNAVCVEARFGGEKCLLMKPTTFMNRSGQSVGEALRFYKLDAATDLVVVVDELAFPIGHIRVRAGGGSAGHNGLKDIDQVLGGAEYSRVRVGIGAKPATMNQADWVLSKVTEEEWPEFESSIDKALKAVEVLVAEGVDAAMNTFNERLTRSENVTPKTHPKETRGDGPGDVHPGWTGSSSQA